MAKSGGDELSNLLTSARQEGSAPYWAHSANAHGNRHRLACYFASVSKLAREFLQGCKGAEEAALAGLLHDLSKYGDLFQARMMGEKSGHASHEPIVLKLGQRMIYWNTFGHRNTDWTYGGSDEQIRSLLGNIRSHCHVDET